MSDRGESIRFLTVTDSATHIHAHHLTYIHNTLRCPTNARQRTYTSTRDFCDHLVPWMAHQEECITGVIEQLRQTCWSWRKLLCETPWQLMQVDDRLEDGMPHTIHSVIVLPMWLVRALCDQRSSVEHSRAVETLVHERMHVMQKVRREWFGDLYAMWGFRAVGTATQRHRDGVRRLHDAFASRTNPDTPHEWVLHDRWYVLVHLPEHTDTMRSVEYYIVDLEGVAAETARPLSLSSPYVHRLDTCAWYNAFYGNQPHCYHPDESSAVLLASLITKEIISPTVMSATPKYACDANKIMVTWLNGSELSFRK